MISFHLPSSLDMRCGLSLSRSFFPRSNPYLISQSWISHLSICQRIPFEARPGILTTRCLLRITLPNNVGSSVDLLQWLSLPLLDITLPDDVGSAVDLLERLGLSVSLLSLALGSELEGTVDLLQRLSLPLFDITLSDDVGCAVDFFEGSRSGDDEGGEQGGGAEDNADDAHID
jgi:hypothetical protein